MNGRPYHLGPRLRGVMARALGLLHLTWDKCHGWPALLLRAPKDRPMPGACQVLVTSYPEYVVAEHRAGRAENVPSVLDMVASAYEAALDEELGRAHLASGKRDTRPVINMTMTVTPPSPPARRFTWVPHALAAAAVTALVWPWTLQHMQPRAPETIDHPMSPLAIDETGSQDTMMLADIVRITSTKGESMTVERRIVMPKKPIEGQDTPPCTSPSKAENGGCWLELKDPPPCPKGAAEHKDACWVPVRGEKPMPMSVDRSVRGRR